MKKFESVKNVIAYNRVSTKNQNFQLQEYAIENLIAKYNFTIVDDSFQEQLSGKTELEEREGIARLQKRCAKGDVDAIIVYDYSRISRDSVFSMEIFKFCAKAKVNLITAVGENELLDENGELTDSNKLNAFFQSIFAEAEWEKIRINLKTGKENKVVNHGYAGYGIYLPYGYKNEDKLLKVDEEEARVVKLIFHLYLIGFGHQLLADLLNAKLISINNNPALRNNLSEIRELLDNSTLDYSLTNNYLNLKDKVLTRTEKIKQTSEDKLLGVDKVKYLWRDKVISDILKNQLYIGKREYAGKRVEVNKDEIRIVTDETFNKVKKLKEVRRDKFQRKSVKFDYSISNKLIKCGVCERNYYPIKRESGRDNRYQCMSKREKEKCTNHGISITTLSSAVWFVLKDNPNIRKHIAETSKREETKDRIEQLKARIKENKKEIKRIESRIDNLNNGDYSSKLYKRSFDKLNAEYVKAENQIESDKEEIANLSELLNAEYTLKNILDSFHANTESIKGILSKFIVKIVLNPMKQNPLMNGDHFKSLFVELYFPNNKTPYCFIISQSSRKIIVLRNNMRTYANHGKKDIVIIFDKDRQDFTLPIEKIKPDFELKNAKRYEFEDDMDYAHFKPEYITIIDSVRKEPETMIKARAIARNRLHSMLVIEEIKDLV